MNDSELSDDERCLARYVSPVQLLFALLLLFGVTLSGCNCGGDHIPIEADDYERGCQNHAECVLVWEGNVCCGEAQSGGCGVKGNTAINRSDEATYISDYDELKQDCQGECGGVSSAGCPPERVARCWDNQCVAVATSSADFDAGMQDADETDAEGDIGGTDADGGINADADAAGDGE